MTSVDHFFLLGAGASYGARDGERRPVLGAELAEYLRDWFVRNYTSASAFERENKLDVTAPGNVLVTHPELARKGRELLDTASREGASSGNRFERQLGDLVERLQSEEKGLPSHRLLRWIHQVITWSMLTGAECRFGPGTDRLDRLLTEVLRSRKRRVCGAEACARKLQHG